MSARQELFNLTCQDMPVSPGEATEAIRAADVELAAAIKAYADGRRSMHGEHWYDAMLEMAGFIATLPPVVAP